MEYLYAGKVDCIYIDPPYNTGARDWKYNNDYVDSSDSYRHSKWLSMMEKRLKLAKKLLNPKDSVLIVTIDEKEYLHLGCLLEEMFPESNIQMISSRINATGIVRQNTFTRVDEYIYFVMIGASSPLTDSVITDEVKPVLWHGLWRRDIESRRGTAKGGTAQFYPIYVNDATCKIEKIGDPLPPEMDRNTVGKLAGCTTVFPLRPDGTEMNWGLIGPVLEDRIKKGYVRVKRKRGKEKEYTIEYLTSGYIKDIESGKAIIQGYAEDGSIIANYQAGSAKIQLPTQWDIKTHYSKENGTGLLRKLLCGKLFSFPKSLYAVRDCIRYFVANKPNALIVDFFAGSGTTLHAVNLLNAEDDGHRRCIMVTNNEVSDAEAKSLTGQGYQPGDEEWEQYGIARYVAWPRTVCSIEGHDVNGHPLKGNYLGSDLPMADGFKANAVYFKLGFLDKTSVALGRQFAELLPVLWMKAGAIGRCPTLQTNTLPDMLILPENHFAVLLEETAYTEFEERMRMESKIDVAFLVTDYDISYRTMCAGLNVPVTYQLYRDYLDNFRINHRRG
ncbi:MAG: site-specific DNA-methyltransferase [Lachnospiraceae bacterium]|nr:site-specific DNA-methyltransferase [Lachnospiraceae bacterium]